ncbi:YvcK family protein [Patescibacteria group bacterium]|nr:YvcK family protein [Patescibacteria group bacterium]
MQGSNARHKRVVVVGGGTGTYTVLSGLKAHPVELSAVVSMADDGGSNRVLRDELGLLPTSDIRQCFVALAGEDTESQQLMRDLFLHRFSSGNGLNGMTFGNLFLAALTEVLGSQTMAIERAGEILKIRGRVLPATFTDARLAAEYENGKRVVGEHLIDEPKHDPKLRISRLWLEPEAEANPDAREAILEADLVVLGPGDLYTSILASILPSGIGKALQETKAQKVYVLNLVTRPGQTHGFGGRKHLQELESYAGVPLDAVLANTALLPLEILQKYEREGSFPVADDFGEDARVRRAALLSAEEVKPVAGDVLKRSLIRHNKERLAEEIMKLI